MRMSTALLPILLGCTALSAPSVSFAQVAIGVSITLAPPALPIYVQPPIPAIGYVWTPGWWQYGADGYYWVPGTWVQPPAVGLLWTPGYWGWNNGSYAWNAPYWGQQVGYYGGINYGYGYGGNGYAGGRWNNGAFAYNRAVNNFGTTRIINVYNEPVANNAAGSRVSFNGGTGGVSARPTPQQLTAEQGPHTPPTAVQAQHIQAAAGNRALLATANHGTPPIAATSRPAQFTGRGIVASHGATAPVAASLHPAAPGPAITAHAGSPALRAPTAAEHPAQQGVARPQTVPALRPAVAMHPAGNAENSVERSAPHPSVPAARPAAPQQIRTAAPAIQHAPAPAAQVHEVRAPQERLAPAPQGQSHPAPEGHAGQAPAGGHEERRPPG